ncbi:MAG: type II toxin-antitoxin system HicB family antitoxin [Calditrichaeota bacterium]|nr:type II toxin-antitoxin system HicB family antitoxin [Calditrichota bacterium]
MKIYNLKVRIEPSDDGGYFAECPVLQGCYTSGETFDDVIGNIREAIRVHIEDRIADGESIPAEINLSESIETLLSVEV